ncbi:LysR family transcriptional regulator [Roseomonas sp. SSH11]|uniref:LysR family transcriptional regulator n=1 Tax=Pararoseomonas baculiformis TaxID=2820812 RepID=A0ABS4AIS9_9PROT|nr:LysR family transcriptional regulator [Pararoseomonas baculiformis]MBP0446911.1 LysR family transcriptional regulator [Pararoseomonas baculiformis]
MIDKLGFLLALARERNFRRAAEACGVAQPTLSAGIKQLETELGVLLVHRSSRFQGLTPEGEKVVEWGRRLLGDVRAMRQELQVARGGLQGHLRLAVIPTALAMVPALTLACRRRHPGMRFTILSRTSAAVLEMIENLEADAGITYIGNEKLGRVRSVPLATERYRLVVPAGSPWCGRDAVAWAELAGQPLCLLTPDMQNRRIMDQLLQQAGVAVEATVESNSIVTLIAHVRSGHWMTVLPESVAATMGGAGGLHALPLVSPDAGYRIGLVVPLHDPTPPLTAALLAEALRISESREEV